MVRIDHECASGELGRLAGKLSPLRHRQRVSIIREERGVVRNQCFGTAIGIRSLGVAPECLIRAREEDPSVRVVGTCLEPLREAVDHCEDLLVGHVMRAALSARRSDRLGLAQQRVEDECCRWDQHQQGDREEPGALARGRGRSALAWSIDFLPQAARELRHGGFVLFCTDDAIGKLGWDEPTGHAAMRALHPQDRAENLFLDESP